jgi:hypothetical protein
VIVTAVHFHDPDIALFGDLENPIKKTISKASGKERLSVFG